MVRKLTRYLGEYKKLILYCVLLVVGEVLCELTLPLLMARIVDVGIEGRDIPYIAAHGGVMVLLAVLGICLGVLNAKFSAKASQGFAANLRRELFFKTHSFSFSNIDRFSGASLITRMTSDVTQLQLSLMMSLRMLTRAPVMLVSALLMAMSINFRLSWVIVGAIVLLVLGAASLSRAAGRLFAFMQRRIDALNGTVRENLIAIRVVKAFVREDNERKKFEKVNNALTDAAIRAGGVVSLIMPMMMLVLNGTTIAVIWLGGNLVGVGSMTTGALMSFISYILQILFSVMIFAMIFLMLARARACAERAIEVLETEPDVHDPAAPAELRVRKGKIEFQNVFFRYASENGDGESGDVLSDISFTVQPGEFVGIIGGTGSGKTSLVSLIPRFYDATGGRVLVDGADVRAYTQQNLRNGIGMVMQKNNLFSGTIRENLKWGSENATQEEIEKAARDAQAHTFIKSFPGGYDTELGQGGVNVSGGQKQRLCIARAMLKKPPILILDDSTSAVDTATESRIRQSFRRNLKDTTVLIVAQRISSVREADRIIVLDDGRVSGIGTHGELYASNDVYREICNSQSEGGVA